jgi:hypothetical protein
MPWTYVLRATSTFYAPWLEKLSFVFCLTAHRTVPITRRATIGRLANSPLARRGRFVEPPLRAATSIAASTARGSSDFSTRHLLSN